MEHRSEMIEEIAARRNAELQDEAGGAESAGHPVGQPAIGDPQLDAIERRAQAAQAAVQLRESIEDALEAALDGDVDTAATMLSSAIAEQPAHTPEGAVESVAYRVRLQLVHDQFSRAHEDLLRDPVAARAVDEEFSRLCPRDSNGAPIALAPAQFESLLEEAAIAVGNVRRAGDTGSGESSPEGRRNAIQEIARGRGQAPFESGER